MIAYTCKYAPLELLRVFDDDHLINNNADQFEYAQSVMHPNMCSHIKAVLEDIHKNKYDRIFLINCCDSTRRLSDVLKRERLAYHKMLDLPVETGSCAAMRLKSDLLEVIQELEALYHKPFDKAAFLRCFPDEPPSYPAGPFVLLLGARSNTALVNIVQSCFDIPVIDATCTNNRTITRGTMNTGDSIDELMEKYAFALLNQSPCMRMADVQSRKKLLNHENCAGIIYHTIQFCDYYDYEYSQIKSIGIPLLKIETDFTAQSSGQILTRIEGFAEALKRKKEHALAAGKSGKYYAGIDSGSTSTELVILDENKNIIRTVMVRTGANAGAGAEKALAQSGIAKSDIRAVTATGYGRRNIAFADSSVTEITCHAKGAKHLFPQAEAIIDIGGQDSKVITLDADGNVSNFVMNDKCAAGTGRFLENMAKVLEIDMDTMANSGLKYKNDLTISSMCTVFAESEVVSLIAENHPIADIIHGLNKSVAQKTKALARSAAKSDKIVMTGGVANNRGVVTELEKQLNTRLLIPEKPEFCGALGAALIALEGK